MRPRRRQSVNFITAHDGFTLAISFPTITSTTRPTAKTIATAPTTTIPGTMASKGRATTIPKSRRRARATCAICWRCCSSRAARRCCRWARRSATARDGNNNAYAQDNAISWIDWSKADLSLYAFTQKLIAVRQSAAGAVERRLSDRRPVRRQRLARRRMARRRGRTDFARTMAGRRSAHSRRRIRQLRWREEPIASRSSSIAAIEETIVQLPEARARMSWRVLIDTSDARRPRRMGRLA